MRIKLTKETGWTAIPGDTKTIVAHYKSGDSRSMDLIDFLVLRNKADIVEIDCLKEPLTE